LNVNHYNFLLKSLVETKQTEKILAVLDRVAHFHDFLSYQTVIEYFAIKEMPPTHSSIGRCCEMMNTLKCRERRSRR